MNNTFENLIGYDALIKKMSKGFFDNSPPYSVYMESPTKAIIRFAVPGYSKDDINVRLFDDILQVYKSTMVADYEEFDHAELRKWKTNTISSGGFTKTFFLYPGSTVVSTTLEAGILEIVVSLPEVVEDKEVKKFEINVPQPSAKTYRQLLNEDSTF